MNTATHETNATGAEPLDITVVLTVERDTVLVSAGSVTACRLHLEPFGFTGRVSFWRAFDHREDDVVPLVDSAQPMELRLSVSAALDDPKVRIVPLVVTGLVTSKAYREVAYRDGSGDKTILQRHYTIDFADKGGVLWRQHFPCLLLADATLGEAIKATTVQGVALKRDWPFLDEARTVVFMSCGGTDLHTSYFDWLCWLVSAHGGHLYYDYATAGYVIAGAKSQAKTVTKLRQTDVSSATVAFPEECRHVVRVLNATTDAPKSDTVAQDRAAPGCRADIVVREPVTSSYESRKTLESGRLVSRGRELEVQLQRFPSKAFRPNEGVAFSQEFSTGSSWGADSYRVVELRFVATAEQTGAEEGKDHARAAFTVDLNTCLEPTSNEWRRVPSFRLPRYPLHVEGRVVSDRGETLDKTYQIGTDAQSSAEAYTVNVPLWNAALHIPFGPTNLPGHFFFPAFKDNRVLVSLWFDSARIEHFLDHGAGVALPQDSQGNHILFGPNGTEQTSFRHEFVDKKPVFSIKRTCKDDTQLVKLEEGNILLITQEEQSLGASTATFDLTPKVALAQSNLTMAKEEGLGGMTAQFESTSAELTGAISGAVADAATQLEVMDQAISEKVSEVEAKIAAATETVGEKTEELETTVKEAKKALLERLRL